MFVSFRSSSSFDLLLIFFLLLSCSLNCVLERSCNFLVIFIFVVVVFGELPIVGRILWNIGSGSIIVDSPTSFVKFCILCWD